MEALISGKNNNRTVILNVIKSNNELCCELSILFNFSHPVSNRFCPFTSPHPTAAITNNTILVNGSGWDGGRPKYKLKLGNVFNEWASYTAFTPS